MADAGSMQRPFERPKNIQRCRRNLHSSGLHGGALETNQEREKAKTYFQKKIRRDTFYRASLKTYS